MKPIIAYSPPYGENYLKEFELFSFMHSCGINTVKLILSNSMAVIGIPYSPYPLIWKNFEEYDFGVVDRQIQDIMKYNPEVRLIPMIDLNSPPWMVKATGKDSFNNLGECFLDPEWLRLVSSYQEALISYLEKNYADRITAYYIACGRTQEWFDMGMFSSSPRREEHYKKWCAKHGREVLPIPEESEYDGYKELPVLPKHLVQWKEFGNALTAECAAYFFKKIRSQIRPEALIGVAFGSVHDLGHIGHLNAEWVFREAPPDFYIGPSCNSEIPMGGASGFQSSQLMLKRYGIGYLHSCDRQLSTTEYEVGPGIRVKATGIEVRQKNAVEDVTCLKREFAIAIVHGFSLWFFNIWGGSYRGKEVREQIRQFGSLWKEYAGRTSGTDAETLLVFSAEAGFYSRNRWWDPDDKIDYQLRRRVLPEAGIPFTTAEISDLYETDLSPYKMIVFLCTDYLSDKNLKMIRERVCCGHRVVAWCNHPGVANEQGINTNRMEAVCGIPFGQNEKGVKEFDQWSSFVFPSLESCTAEGFREAGMKAGLHFFSDSTDLRFWSSPEFLSVHTKEGGIKEIRLKKRVRRVTELFSGKVKGENCISFRDEFASPDTRLYYLEN